MIIGDNNALCQTSSVGMVGRNPTITEQLQGRKQDLEARLVEINEAIKALEKSPEVESILNLIAKVRY